MACNRLFFGSFILSMDHGWTRLLISVNNCRRGWKIACGQYFMWNIFYSVLRNSQREFVLGDAACVKSKGKFINFIMFASRYDTKFVLRIFALHSGDAV